MKSNNVLRATIREILMENYNVSIVATPIITTKRKRGDAQLDDIIANVVLGEKELADFIELANSKDLVNTAASEASDEIMSRIRSIEERVGPGAAKLAMSSTGAM
jgi:Asp-tRNA(Asn)/Glu-tRNA(Gln) amidotransferase B subunit